MKQILVSGAYYAFILLSVIVWIAPYVSPKYATIFAFLALLILPLCLAHLIVLIYLAWVRSAFLWISLGFLLLAWPSLRATYGLHFFSASSSGTFQVLSYNARVFNSYDHLHADDPQRPERMIAWLAQQEAEIKCIQEFYHRVSPEDGIYNTLKRIGTDRGYAYQIVYPSGLAKTGQYFGTIILSKFPVIASGDFPLEKHWHKRGVYMDIKIQEDTIRVISVHLQSLFIDDSELLKKEDDYQLMKSKYFALYRKLKYGYYQRALQVEFLEKFIQGSPYPIILCGDMNDLPYSYTYQRLRKYFYNSFEEAGAGWGFSYRGKIPFLRIDQQFFSDAFRVHYFRTLYEMPDSDHYPILAEYSLR